MATAPFPKPLGVVLQQAGLVSAEQIEIALEEQKCNRRRLGEILVLHGWLKQRTADFFAQKWLSLKVQSPKRPLGQILKEAALLDDDRVEAILEIQKQTGGKFGEISIRKGWLSKKTVTFFLKHVASQSGSSISADTFDWHVLKELEELSHSPAPDAEIDETDLSFDKLADQRRSSKLSAYGSLIALGLLFSLIFYEVINSARNSPSQPLTSARQSSTAEICLNVSGGTRTEQIEQLRELQHNGGSLDVQCQQLKDELLFTHAIETLASNNQQDAVVMLCEVTESYYQNQPKLTPYFRRWSESSDRFQSWLELYLLNNPCPVAKYLI